MKAKSLHRKAKCTRLVYVHAGIVYTSDILKVKGVKSGYIYYTFAIPWSANESSLTIYSIQQPWKETLERNQDTTANMQHRAA